MVPKVDGAWLVATPGQVGETVGIYTVAAAKNPDQLIQGVPKERQNPDREIFFRQIHELLGDWAAEIQEQPRRPWWGTPTTVDDVRDVIQRWPGPPNLKGKLLAALDGAGDDSAAPPGDDAG